jgi:hypothetical protein
MFVRLYHSPGTRATGVVWTLEEIGEPYDVKIVTREDRGSEEYRQRHPLGHVPPEPMPGGDLAPGENARVWSPTSATLISGEKSAPTALTDSPRPETGG